MHLFVTVGTTEFKPLVDEIVYNIKFLREKYTEITIQSGSTELRESREYKSFKYLPNIDYGIYDIIVTHCGTGSILNGLMVDKKVVAVVNSELKDNHQIETKKIFKNYINIVELRDLIEFLNKGIFIVRNKFKLKKVNKILNKFIE